MLFVFCCFYWNLFGLIYFVGLRLTTLLYGLVCSVALCWFWLIVDGLFIRYVLTVLGCINFVRYDMIYLLVCLF